MNHSGLALTSSALPSKGSLSLGSLFFLFFSGVSSVACHRQPVLTTPASDQAVYAGEYAERLQDVRARFAADEEKTRKSFDALRALPSSVPPANADELERVVREADAAGRSQPYVDEALRQEDVDSLMGENKNAIRRRIAGAVATAAKEKQKEQKEKEQACLKDEEVDALANTAAAATDRAVDRQLEQRLRARNPAHRELELSTEEFGAARVNALEPKVDTLTRASFVANVRLHLYRLELDDLLDQEKAVLSTLERDEAAARAALERDGLSKPYRLAMEERAAKDAAARQSVPAEITASQGARKDLEARAEALQRDYRALVDVLLAELRRFENTPQTGFVPEKGTPAASGPVPAPAAPEHEATPVAPSAAPKR